MYSVPGGSKFDLSLRSEDELKEVELIRREATFSYKDGDAFVFLDDEDYTPYQLDADVVGDMAGYITEGLEGCYVQIIDDVPVAVLLPPASCSKSWKPRRNSRAAPPPSGRSRRA